MVEQTQTPPVDSFHCGEAHFHTYLCYMVTPQIISYVQAQLSQSVSEEKIAGDLSKVGWSSTDIAAIFEQLRASAALTTPPAPQKTQATFTTLPKSSSGEGVSGSTSGMSKAKYYALAGIIGIVVFILGMAIGYAYTQHLIPFFSKQ